jgi:hypothetical protein
MGLVYQLPVDLKESDYIELNSSRLVIKSYGLPTIFGYYALATLLLLLALTKSAYAPVLKIYAMSDEINHLLATLLIVTLFCAYLMLVLFYYSQIQITLTCSHCKKELRVFGLTYLKESIAFSQGETKWFIQHFMQSPNMARLRPQTGLEEFQNRGYFELIVQVGSKTLLVDRSSRKNDLENIKQILEESQRQIFPNSI